jgi:hypothetical protein
MWTTQGERVCLEERLHPILLVPAFARALGLAGVGAVLSQLGWFLTPLGAALVALGAVVALGVAERRPDGEPHDQCGGRNDPAVAPARPGSRRTLGRKRPLEQCRVPLRRLSVVSCCAQFAHGDLLVPRRECGR